MAYEKYNETWESSPSKATPITAEFLNHIEQGLVDVETTPGPKGTKGEKGAQGPAGADGFPSEEQWNGLVARVEALEQ